MDDRYLSYDECYRQLKAQFKKHGRLYIAYDFDDTVWATGPYDNCRKVPHLIRVWRPYSYLILFTARDNEDLPMITDFLKRKNIPYDEVGKNTDLTSNHYKNNSPKPYFNILLDDKAALPMTYNMLVQLAKEEGFWYDEEL